TVLDCTNGVWGEEADGIDDIVCLRVADFDREKFTITPDNLTIRAVEPKQRESRKLKKGDLLIEKSGGGEKQLVGCVVYFDHEFDAVSSNFVARMTVDPKHSARYICYLHAGLYAGRLNYPAIKQTTGIQNLDTNEYLNTLVAYPPMDEQQQIAAFLDWKTGQIDALIAKKKELLEKLKEKRLAVITQAVTKGLDPAAPLRDSGIPWLGQMPEHWEVIPLGILMTMSGGMTPSMANSEYWEGEIPWVTPKDMKQPRISDSIDHVTEKALEETAITLIPLNAILIVVRGMILAHSFPTAITEAPVTINQDMKALRCGDQLEVQFLFWCLTGFAKVLSNLAQESAHGTRKVETETLKKFAFPVPPLAEQRAIQHHIEDRLGRLDNLADSTAKTIARLTEYRTALITAATTGKIDVRDVVIPSPA
ncbi:MAG TPA: restriction endonuclease subunit S, partial [Gallionella sp.]|nr:restriction endonuclease subunit S [Gallionella sp.]